MKENHLNWDISFNYRHGKLPANEQINVKYFDEIKMLAPPIQKIIKQKIEEIKCIAEKWIADTLVYQNTL